MIGLSVTEFLVVLGIVILLFSSKKISRLAKGIGQGIREFKKFQTKKEMRNQRKKIPNFYSLCIFKYDFLI